MELKEADLAGVGQVPEGASRLQILNVGFGNLGTGDGKLLDGDEPLALPPLQNVPGGSFTQA